MESEELRFVLVAALPGSRENEEKKAV